MGLKRWKICLALACIYGIVEYNGDINLTKSAIVCADRVNDRQSPVCQRNLYAGLCPDGLHHILQMYC